MTTDEAVLSAFAALPLPVRMRAARVVLDEFIERGPVAGTFVVVAGCLDIQADAVEAEDAAEADRERQVRELAPHLYSVCEPPDALAWDGNIYTGHQDRWMERARALLERFDITPKVKP